MSRVWVKLLSACAALALGAASANAGLLVYEPLDYPAGSALENQVASNGQAWSTAGTGDDILVAPGNLIVAGLPAPKGNSAAFGGLGKTERVGIASSPVTSGTLYYSLALKFVSPAPASQIFIAGFNVLSGPQAANPTTVGTRLYVKAGATGGVLFGTSKNSSVAADIGFDATERSLDQTFFIVGSYQIVDDGSGLTGTDDISKLWINPNASTFGTSAAPGADVTAPLTGNDLGVGRFPQIASFLLRQGIRTLPDVQVDELRIGTSWADVTGASAPPAIPLPPAAIPGAVTLAGSMVLALRRARG
jgi:hypothetical protein